MIKKATEIMREQEWTREEFIEHFWDETLYYVWDDEIEFDI